jgi:hypothetical protein
MEIGVEKGSDPVSQAMQPNTDGMSKGSDPLAADHRSLRVILARLLLEMQGAGVVCGPGAVAWVARIEFPGRG